MSLRHAQKGVQWIKENVDSGRRPKSAVHASSLRPKSKNGQKALKTQQLTWTRQERPELEARISRLSLYDEMDPSCRQTKHICRARRKRDSSDDDDVDIDDIASSMGSNPLKDAESDDDDDDDEDADIDAGQASTQDPTTRLFQMVKEKDYDDDEEENLDDEDDDHGLPSIDNSTERERRGRKRKAVYDTANQGAGLGVEDDLEMEGDSTESEPDLTDDDGDIGLDNIIDNAFVDDGIGIDDVAEERERLPSKASQHRPDELGPQYAETPLIDDDLMEDDHMEPLMQYSEPPQRRYLLGDLLRRCGYDAPSPDVENVEITSIRTEWEQVEEGSLYVDLQYGLLDRFDAIGLAIDSGATAVLSENEIKLEGHPQKTRTPVIVLPDIKKAASRLATIFYDDPSNKMTVVGITGSRGKTTTSWFIRGIFEEMQLITGMIGSLENSIAVDKMTDTGDIWKPEEEDPTLKRECSTAFHVTPYIGKYEPPSSTPNVVQVQAVMAGMADRGATACVYEAGLYEASEGRTDNIDMDVGVYMGFTREDIDNAESIEDLLEGQKKFFGSLKDSLRQTAVINMDDDYYELILEYAKEVPSVTFSVNDDTADVYVVKSSFSIWDTDVQIHTPAGRLQIVSTLIGRHNLPNILAAVATGLALTIDDDGIPLQAIVNGIRATEIVPGRCEVIDEHQDFGVVVDSASTPESLSRLLDSIREAGPRNIFLVFGCEGGMDKTQRPFMGEIAHYKADTVILTNDNPRNESPNSIIADIVAGYPDEILSLNAMQAYPPGFLQDPGRVQFEALEFAWHNCYEFRRYVMEDRWMAIRWAIGTAGKKDIVVIAGKGAEDYQEYILEGEFVRSWFDDRVECRNALAKVAGLKKFDGDIDRRELPWMEPDERGDNLRAYNVAAD